MSCSIAYRDKFRMGELGFCSELTKQIFQLDRKKGIIGICLRLQGYSRWMTTTRVSQFIWLALVGT
jgi:hypothetical protein